MKKITTQKTQGALIKAVRLLLQPLVKLLIQHHVTFPQMREVLKELYIEAAREIIQADGQKDNYSRLYVLTGVHRKKDKRDKRVRSLILNSKDKRVRSLILNSGELLIKQICQFSSL